MAEAAKVLYIVVVDDGGEKREGASFRYTRPVLQSTLQLMGCKARHAFKISQRVFDVIRSKGSADHLTLLEDRILVSDALEGLSNKESDHEKEKFGTSSSIPFELYKRLTSVVVTREIFLDLVCDALSAYNYVGPNQKADLVLACRIRERKESVTVLLCGTSGCGKSTLSALLGSRLGIKTVISTDSIRHMMRSFVDEKQNPLLWASTYHAGECLDPEAVAEAKAKRKEKKQAGISLPRLKEELSDSASNEKNDGRSQGVGHMAELIGKKQMAIEGFKAQSEMVIDSLDRLITAWEDRRESVVVEGVHLSLNFVMGLMKKHPSIMPFMIYISNEDKHMERFAVRAKYMTLDPAKNKYVKYMRNIRTIQDYLCNRADKHRVPKINNTNVDRSVALIHATVFSCLRRREAGEQLYDPTTNTVPVLFEEYRNHCAANSLSSKGMFQLIQRKGSSRHLVALLKTDGSVAKAWPVEPVDSKGKLTSSVGSERCVGSPTYCSLHIGRAEPVNLQFGNLGIVAWHSDNGGTSQTGSIDDCRPDGSDTGSRYFSSRCSSPGVSEGPAKEPMEELSVFGSEEEADDPPAVDSEEDLSDADKEEIHKEMEGSVDEESTKSDEEYEDLAMRDNRENGYCSDDEEEPANVKRTVGARPTEIYSVNFTADDQTEKYLQDSDILLKTNEHVLELQTSDSLISENHQNSTGVKTRKRSPSESSHFRGRSQSICGSSYGASILSGPSHW